MSSISITAEPCQFLKGKVSKSFPSYCHVYLIVYLMNDNETK